MKYSEERKRSVLAKLSPPHNRSIKEVSEEEGLSLAILYSWRRHARELGELYSAIQLKNRPKQPTSVVARSARREKMASNLWKIPA